MKRFVLKFSLPVLFSTVFGQMLFGQWKSFGPVLADPDQFIQMLKIAPNDPKSAWALHNDPVGDNQQLMVTRTSDGGQTWKGLATPAINKIYGSGICALDSLTAWVASTEGNNYQNFIHKTSDGGLTWEQQGADLFTSPGSYCDVVHFWDNQHGVAFGDASVDTAGNAYFEFYTTDDGGQTWSPRLPYSPMFEQVATEEAGGLGNGYQAIGNTIWIETANYATYLDGFRLFRSKDFGHTWEAFSLGGSLFCTFADELNGISRHYNGADNSWQLYRTTDGGETWQPTGTLAGRISGLAMVPQSLALVAVTRKDVNTFNNFTTSVSYDFGVSWITVDVSNTDYPGRLQFASPSIGYGGIFLNAIVTGTEAKMYTWAGNPISGVFSKNKLDAEVNIFPNPVADWVQMDFKTENPTAFVALLNDLEGRLIERKDIGATANGSVIFDLNNQPAGIYQITLSSSAGMLTRQVVKK